VISAFLFPAKRPLLQATDQKGRLLKKYQRSLRQERTRFLNSLVGTGLGKADLDPRADTHVGMDQGTVSGFPGLFV